MPLRNKAAQFAMTVSVAALVASTATASSHREAPGITEQPKVDASDFYMFKSYEPGRGDYVTLIANYIPLQAPYGGPNYFTMDPDAIYEIHIDNDGDAVEDITFQFDFNNELANEGMGIALPIGDATVAIPLRTAGQITGAASDPLNEIESYTLTHIAGDRRSGTRTPVTGSNGAKFGKPLDYIGEKTFPNYSDYANSFIDEITIPGCEAKGKVFVGQRAEAFAVNLGQVFDLVNLVPLEGSI